MGEVNDSFEIIARAIFDQPDHVAYLILDQKLYKIPDYKNDIKTNLSPIEARTIEELAEKCGLPPDGLRATVEEFNNTATKSADPASPIPLNSSTKTLSPAKSHWASKLDESPFVCYPVEGTIQFTYGGIATDDKGRVIDTNNTPILGLYAAGEMVGLSYSRYTAATSVLRSLTYGRIAGFEAVGWILEERKK
jgi:tricarballylate dehydrogenase